MIWEVVRKAIDVALETPSGDEGSRARYRSLALENNDRIRHTAPEERVFLEKSWREISIRL